MLKLKSILILSLIVLLGSCHSMNDDNKQLHQKIDSLELSLKNSYKPGFGEFMSSVQMHHAKLWFAGKNENWKLADFEIHEIIEAIENIKKFEKDRPESKKIGMIDEPLNDLNKAIEQKNPAKFVEQYTRLTQTCNDCHVNTNFEFNKVVIPTSLPVVNQDFSLKEK